MPFYATFSEMVVAQNVVFSEKEFFVLSTPVHVLQAVLSLDVYCLKENLGLYDASMVMSTEMAKAHVDSFNEYALSLGGK